jgi:hypothetical protein
MHLRSRTTLFLLALTLGAGAACDDNTTTTTTPTTPGTSTSESFPGAVTVNGAVTHQFAATQRGNVTATLSSIDPDASQTLGISLGTWNGTACQIIIANDQAVVGSSILGVVSGVGNLCVRVYDVGKLSRAENYKVDVTHP